MQIQEVFEIVKEDLQKVEESFKESLNSNVYFIGKVIEYILTSGGKRFRPLVLVLSARLCGYRGERHIPLAGVVEFIHTATLLHDDVVDNADLRRGKSTANSIWGNEASVLVGDYLLSKAFYLAVADGDLRVLDVLSTATTRMAEGEVLQLLKHSDPETTEEEYLEVITNKTAVLFSAACQLAAILAGVPSDKETAMARYGMNIGIAYQLADDCLDYTSNDEHLGKAIGNDLREGKVTMPLIHVFKHSTPQEREIIRNAVQADELKESDLRTVLSLINKYGGIEYTFARAKSHIEDAKRQLDMFEPNLERAAMMAVADYVINRTY